MSGQRLVVELSEKADRDLELLSLVDGDNKSTVISRAIQVYKLVTDAAEVLIDGDRLVIES